MSAPISWRLAPLLPAAVLLAACATPTTRNPLPEAFVDDAVVVGFPQAIRAWGDEAPPDLDVEMRRMRAQLAAADPEGWGPSGEAKLTLLALSGGADDGAFGAGILDAWSDSGDRPEFTLVTGVSTGSLTAPFAFLGPQFDQALVDAYTSVTPEDVYTERTFGEVLGGASLADTGPLRRKVASYVTDDFLAMIAAEHATGRRLLIQTFHVDAQRPMIWNMGEIAAIGTPEARDLFINVLLASSSPPGFFPPVKIEVEAGGETFDELHADGGVVGQQTALGGWTLSRPGAIRRVFGEDRKAAIYIVRNGYITPEYAATEAKNVEIGRRAVSTMIKYFAALELAFEWVAAREEGSLQFYMTWMSDDFDGERASEFDPEYMRELYQYGYDKLASGEAWAEKPPFLAAVEARPKTN